MGSRYNCHHGSTAGPEETGAAALETNGRTAASGTAGSWYGVPSVQPAIVLASAVENRVALVVSVAPELVARGVKAGAVVKAAAAVVGGGGGGRDTLAQAGGRDVSKLEEALATAREQIAATLAG